MPSERDTTSLDAGLYLVATPIGNLQDITLRALDVLGEVDLVLAEDTRRTRKLLTHHGIRTSLKSLHDHNETARAKRLAERLAAGERMALVSDAGTPLISDPGHALVRAALDADVAVIPIPGPSSLLAALTGSGLALDRFTFCGYLPRKAGARRRLFEELADEPGTLVFLESPRRLVRSLADAAEVLGERSTAIGRELTKMHEEFIRGTLPEVAARLAGAEVRGEVTVCVAGAKVAAAVANDASKALDRHDLDRSFAQLLEEGTPRNDALKALARRHGVPRREIYRALLVEEEESR